MLAMQVYPGRRTICMSLRNHGASPNTDTPMTIDNLAADVAATLPHAVGSNAPVHIVGHSLGGKVAMALALAQPALVKRMVVADISPVVYDKYNAQWQEVVDICAAVDEMDLSRLQRRSDGHALLTERGIVSVATHQRHHAPLPYPLCIFAAEGPTGVCAAEPGAHTGGRLHLAREPLRDSSQPAQPC